MKTSPIYDKSFRSLWSAIIPFFALLMFLIPKSHGASDFFAKELMRNLFSIQIIAPAVIETRMGNTNPPIVPSKISVIVWNMYKGKRLKDKHLPFKLFDYDFSLIQEDSDFIINEKLKGSGQHYFLPTFKKASLKTGVSIISQYIANEVYGFHSHFKEPLLITPKSALIADFGKLRIINIHSLNFVGFEEWQKQLEKILPYSSTPEFVIFGGDFNTWSDERLNYLKEVMKREGLSMVEFKKDLRTKHFGNIVDHIFVKGFTLRSAEILPLEDYSDHNALEVVLEVLN